VCVIVCCGSVWTALVMLGVEVGVGGGEIVSCKSPMVGRTMDTGYHSRWAHSTRAVSSNTCTLSLLQGHAVRVQIIVQERGWDL
jgi:hypothetical protein